MKNINLKDFINISNDIGNKPEYIQSGGGNTSYKENGILYVKASGTLLKNMSINSGIAEIDLDKLNKYLRTPDNDANFFASTIQSYCLNNQKPSIETGLHAIIPNKYVIHSHSVYANVVMCAVDATKILDDIFGKDYVFVPYAAPGVELIRQYLDVYNRNSDCKVIFLQNHGVVTFNDSPTIAVQEHYFYSEKIKSVLNLCDFNDIEMEDIMNYGYLFPDQIVFSTGNDKLSEAYQETAKAYTYIYKNIIKLGLKPNFLSEKNVADVLGMDSEKYRASLNLKNSI